MSDRPTAEIGPLACPFVAFEDDRGRRSVAPDHRHRCFAELRPAPRALAHQATYCLSAGFAACPTFQDWARRQAAREVAADAREVAADAREAGTAWRPPGDAWAPDEAPAPGEAPPSAGLTREQDVTPLDEPRPPRRPRDWTAPPPWVAEGGADPRGGQLGAFDVLDEGPARPSRPPARPEPGEGGDPELAALLRPGGIEDDEGEVPGFLVGRVRGTSPRPGRPPAGRPISQARPVSPRLRRPMAGDPDAPPWERPRHFEAYPTLRSRASLPRLPGIALALAALGAAALLLFFLPSLLTAPAATPVPSATIAATATSSLPTGVPSPTAQVYLVVSGDTISKIAKKFGVSQESLLAANPQIKNPDRIVVGDQIFIPATVTPGALPSETPSPSP